VKGSTDGGVERLVLVRVEQMNSMNTIEQVLSVLSHENLIVLNYPRLMLCFGVLISVIALTI
jgi:hypothetical protein